MTDDNDAIVKKIKRSVTDSLGVVAYNDEQLGIRNLIEIYSKFSGLSNEQIVSDFEGKGYGDFKKTVADAVVSGIEPIRDKTMEYLKDRAYLENVYKLGAQKAEAVASKMLQDVYEKIGFIRR